MKFLITIFFATNVFAINEDYFSLSAKEKSKELWRAIVDKEYQIAPPLDKHKWEVIADLVKGQFGSDNPAVLDDFMPEKCERFIFGHGSVAQVKYRCTEKHPYSGLFAHGAIGLAYFSLLGDPKSIGCFVPALALKFFIDERVSLNIAVLHCWSGVGGAPNWFDYSLSNCPYPAQNFFGKAMEAYFNTIENRSLEHLAKYQRSGKMALDLFAPDQIVFRPSEDVKESVANEGGDFRDNLSTLLKDTVLYEVHARHSPFDPLIKIGELVLKSDVISSEFADCHLVF